MSNANSQYPYSKPKNELVRLIKRCAFIFLINLIVVDNFKMPRGTVLFVTIFRSYLTLQPHLVVPNIF